MVIDHLLVEVGELVVVELVFGAVPLILVRFLDVPVVGVAGYSDLKRLELFVVDSDSGDGIFEELEALSDVVESVEVTTVW